jgi:hypothetical protein
MEMERKIVPFLGWAHTTLFGADELKPRFIQPCNARNQPYIVTEQNH